MEPSVNLYDENIRPIDRIEFSVWGNEEIKNYSALGKDNPGIEIPDLYDNMEPKKGGLIDTRLGVTNNNLECATCGLDTIYCVGHFGHIDFAEPVFHYGYLDFVKKILSCICLNCSKILIYKNEEDILNMLKNKTAKSRLNEVLNITKNIQYCQKPGYGCGTPVAKIKKEPKGTTINLVAELDIKVEEETVEEGKKKIRRILTPDITYDILKNISDIDCMIMGLDPRKARPEMMIHKTFPVSPVAIRPSAKLDFMDSSTKEDGLTIKLAEIVRANIRIRKLKESSGDVNAKYRQDHIGLLQYHVITHFDNESTIISTSEQRGKPIKSLSSRIKGKEGRFRGNLMGKLLLTTGSYLYVLSCRPYGENSVNKTKI